MYGPLFSQLCTPVTPYINVPFDALTSLISKKTKAFAKNIRTNTLGIESSVQGQWCRINRQWYCRLKTGRDGSRRSDAESAETAMVYVLSEPRIDAGSRLCSKAAVRPTNGSNTHINARIRIVNKHRNVADKLGWEPRRKYATARFSIGFCALETSSSRARHQPFIVNSRMECALHEFQLLSSLF